MLDLCPGRMYVQVRIDHAVAAEITVCEPGGRILGDIAVVPTVSPVFAALGILDCKPLIHPVPDAAALHTGMAVHQLPHQVEGAVGIAHCVGILAGHIRLVARVILYFIAQITDLGIHWAMYVGALFAFGALVKHGALHLAGFQFLEHLVGPQEVHAHSGLVPQRKQGNAGIVAGAHIHIQGPVLMLGEPFGMLRERTLTIVHPVAFYVGFVVHIEAKAVAEFVESAGLRIVAGAYGIHVQLLHHQQAAAYIVPVGIMAGKLIVFVEIDPLELDGLPVEVEDVAFDFGAAETHVEAGVLPFLLEHKGIEFGEFSAPPAHAGDYLFERNAALGHGTAVFVQQAEGSAFGGIEAEIAVRAAVVKGGYYLEIEVLKYLFGRKVHIPLYAAEPPEILAFQPRTCAPAGHLEQKLVLPFFEIWSDVDARKVFGILAIGYLGAVDESIYAGFGGADVKVHLPAFPGLGHAETPAVDAHGDILGQGRGLGIEGREFVCGVHIDGSSPSLHLPVTRNLYLLPVLCGKILRNLLLAVEIKEIPFSVQAGVEGALFDIPFQGGSLVREKNDFRALVLYAHGSGIDIPVEGKKT